MRRRDGATRDAFGERAERRLLQEGDAVAGRWVRWVRRNRLTAARQYHVLRIATKMNVQRGLVAERSGWIARMLDEVVGRLELAGR